MLFGRTFLLPLAGLARTALADAATITHAMQTISIDTAALGHSVSAWNGDILGTLPIIGKAGALLLALLHGSDTAEASTPLSVEETLQVVTATQKLSTEVKKTLDAIVVARPKFDHLLLRPIILLALETEKAAADDFSEKVVAKVPQQLQAVAKGLIKDIQGPFEKAITAYSLSL